MAVHAHEQQFDPVPEPNSTEDTQGPVLDGRDVLSALQHELSNPDEGDAGKGMALAIVFGSLFWAVMIAAIYLALV